jgi:hypothetical protein
MSHAIGVGSERFRQDLDRDLPLQPRVGREIDLTHPADAERRNNLKHTETCAGRQSHC